MSDCTNNAKRDISLSHSKNDTEKGNQNMTKEFDLPNLKDIETSSKDVASESYINNSFNCYSYLRDLMFQIQWIGPGWFYVWFSDPQQMGFLIEFKLDYFCDLNLVRKSDLKFNGFTYASSNLLGYVSKHKKRVDTKIDMVTELIRVRDIVTQSELQNKRVIDVYKFELGSDEAKERRNQLNCCEVRDVYIVGSHLYVHADDVLADNHLLPSPTPLSSI